ncbi:hypothetical protein XCR1_920044 [Xenorhabdus cabanillasii JM26]|uniref:Uncharacterized protein n=1 Tax=Xenorhabdus cabanillasii JM26 TaxID=1427517 RepID=W1J9X0_9GAMM|nr:hypothetical protein XCR1_920044 [Xenorhabdus cabanillasii JM26]
MFSVIFSMHSTKDKGEEQPEITANKKENTMILIGVFKSINKNNRIINK